MNTRYVLITAVAFALVLGAAGCAGNASDEAAATRRATEPGSASEAVSDDPDDPANIVTARPDGPYIGAWHARLTEEQARKRGDARLAGNFRLTLRADGTYTAFQSLDGAQDGQYEAASGRRLVFGHDGGCDQGGFGGVGVYRWRLRDGKLTLTNVVPETGGCTGRTDTLVMPVWRRR